MKKVDIVFAILLVALGVILVETVFSFLPPLTRVHA